MARKKRIDRIIQEMFKQFTWKSTRNDQELALRLLKRFYEEYRNAKPDKYLEVYCYELHSRYLLNLFNIRNSLYEHDYGTACHELETLAACNNIYQIRIHANLVKLLEGYCVLENEKAAR